MADAALIYITYDDEEKARALGRALVEERLAACANVLGPMTPIYRWQGTIEEGSEMVLLAKTRASLVDQVTTFVQDWHDYDCPCVLALPIIGGNREFLDWIESETIAPDQTQAR